MFKKLREKLKSWTKKVSKEVEGIKEESPKLKETPEEEEVKQLEEIESKKEAKAEKVKEIVEEKPETKAEIIKEIEESGVPEKIAEAEEKFDEKEQKPLEKPKLDLKKIEKISKDLEEKKKKLQEVKKELEKEEKPIVKEDVIKEKPEEKKGFFSKIVSSKVTFSEKDFEIYGEDLKMLLLENNVAFEVAEKIIEKLKEEMVGKEFLKKEIEGQIVESLKDIIYEILLEPFDVIEKVKSKDEKPDVILFCGINGTGKTTTIAKIAHHLKKQGLSTVLAAADTFRAASIEQINIHAKKLGLKVISHNYGSNPAAVGFDAIKYAKKNRIDCVLIDTAGRMHSEKNLLRELEKISKVCKPDLKLFIGEAITGNDSIEQVRSFNFAIGIDAIILTKADTDEKGGTALSVGHVTKKPILYLGVGQDYDDIQVFDKKKFIDELGL